VLIIEMAAHLFVKASEGSLMTMMGFGFDSASPLPWAMAVLAFAAGVLLLRRVWPRVAAAWDDAADAAQERGLIL
jgi:branched-chain amino acid transport system permease protein